MLHVKVLLKCVRTCIHSRIQFNPVKPLLTDTSLIRTALYYGQFTWSLRDRNPYKAYLSKTDTSIMRTLIPLPLMSVIKGCKCIYNLGQLHLS